MRLGHGGPNGAQGETDRVDLVVGRDDDQRAGTVTHAGTSRRSTPVTSPVPATTADTGPPPVSSSPGTEIAPSRADRRPVNCWRTWSRWRTRRWTSSSTA